MFNRNGFRTITAKYAGTCKRCHGPITPGQKIRFGGRGLTYHLKAECGESAPAGRSYDAIAREGGYEDTMGVSPEVLENRYYDSSCPF